MNTLHTASLASDRIAALAAPRVRQAVGIVSFAILTAASAKFSLPLPGTTVPFTFQPLAVLLAGALLGARLGAASQILYLSLGIFGIPVFFNQLAGPAYLLGPTGGYLIALPFAAYVTGRLVGRSVLRTFAATLAGLSVVHAGGVSWLAVQAGWAAALTLGLVPFILADLVKAAMVVVIAARIRDRCRAIFSA